MAHRLHCRIFRPNPHIPSYLRSETLHLPSTFPHRVQDSCPNRSPETLHGSHSLAFHQARIRDHIRPQIQFKHHAVDKHLQKQCTLLVVGRLEYRILDQFSKLPCAGFNADVELPYAKQSSYDCLSTYTTWSCSFRAWRSG